MSINEFEKGVLEEYRREADIKGKYTNKVTMMLIIALIVSIVGLVVCDITIYKTHKATLDYLQLYDFETTVTTTVEQDTLDGGNANYIGGDGEITNGEAENY